VNELGRLVLEFGDAEGARARRKYCISPAAGQGRRSTGSGVSRLLFDGLSPCGARREAAGQGSGGTWGGCDCASLPRVAVRKVSRSVCMKSKRKSQHLCM